MAIEHDLRRVADRMSIHNSFGLNDPQVVRRGADSIELLRSTFLMAVEDVQHAVRVLQGQNLSYAQAEEIQQCLDCIYDRLMGAIWEGPK